MQNAECRMQNEKRKGMILSLFSFCILHSAFCIGFAALPPRRPRRWIGFFVVLGVLSVIAVVVPLVYNMSLQLHTEQLAQARRRWQAKGPADYDLSYLVKREEGGITAREEEFLVQVRAGRVVLLVEEGEVVYLDPRLAVVAGLAGLAVSAENPNHYGVPALFAEIETAVRQRAAGEQRDYLKADFDPQDGHPSHFIFRRPRTKERVEWFVKLTPLSTP
jgi:hypothetical protein